MDYRLPIFFKMKLSRKAANYGMRARIQMQLTLESAGQMPSTGYGHWPVDRGVSGCNHFLE